MLLLKHLQLINAEVSALWQTSREGFSIDSEERNLKGHQNVSFLTKYKYNPIKLGEQFKIRALEAEKHRVFKML